MLTSTATEQIRALMQETSQKIQEIAECKLDMVLVKPNGIIIQFDGEVNDRSVLEKDVFLRKAVVEVTGVSWEMIASKKRNRDFVLARQIYIWFAYYWIRLSFKAAAGNAGGRDHTTAIHSCNTIRNLLDIKDAKTTSLYLELKNKTEFFRL